MELKKYRWSKAYESAEEELEELMAAKNIDARRWTAEGGQMFDAHMHEKDKRLWCAEGSIVFTVNGQDISMQPGDTLDLPAMTVHEAVAGLTGCACYESPAENPTLPPIA